MNLKTGIVTNINLKLKYAFEIQNGVYPGQFNVKKTNKDCYFT